MHIKLAIVDDSQTDRELLASLIHNWCEETQHTVEISFFASAEAFLFESANSGKFDLLLLDIEMGKMNGVALASAIRKENRTVQIVFITGYSDYIAEGYDVAALHYLMKPLKTDKFKDVLSRAAEKIRQNERFLTITTAEATFRIPLHTIRFLDVYKNYVTIHAEENHTVKRTLGEMETLLDDRFYRVGRGLIVNLSYIKKVTKTEVHLSDGMTLPLPRGAYDGINRAIIGRS